MKRCLIVVDYQNDFVAGTLGFEAAAALESKIVQKITKYRESGGEVVFTLDTHGDDYLDTQEGKHLPAFHCIANTPGHGLYGRVANLVKPEDNKFIKNTFGSDKLFDYLKGKSFKSVELIGVVSHICVISNAVLAKTALPEVPIIIDAACTAGNDKDLHRCALDIMRNLHMQIINE